MSRLLPPYVPLRPPFREWERIRAWERLELGAGIHASTPHLSAGALLTVVLGYGRASDD